MDKKQKIDIAIKKVRAMPYIKPFKSHPIIMNGEIIGRSVDDVLISQNEVIEILKKIKSSEGRRPEKVGDKSKEIPIKVKMTIKVDKCIAREIKELIEIHKIETHYSCCGHAGKFGWVIVWTDESRDKLLSLGYFKEATDKMYSIAIGSQPKTLETYICSRFTLKTKCKCREG